MLNQKETLNSNLSAWNVFCLGVFFLKSCVAVWWIMVSHVILHTAQVFCGCFFDIIGFYSNISGHIQNVTCTKKKSWQDFRIKTTRFAPFCCFCKRLPWCTSQVWADLVCLTCYFWSCNWTHIQHMFSKAFVPTPLIYQTLAEKKSRSWRCRCHAISGIETLYKKLPRHINSCASVTSDQWPAAAKGWQRSEIFDDHKMPKKKRGFRRWAGPHKNQLGP